MAALGALVPAESALGGGSAAEYVDGLHQALAAGALLAIAGAIAAVLLIRPRRDALAEQPATPQLVLDAA